MLFNSYIFVFLFLPIVLVGLWVIDNSWRNLKFCWLILASLFFYAWWKSAYLWLILGSIIFNFSVGFFLNKNNRISSRKIALFIGVAGNLSLIAYYKYFDFFAENLNAQFNVDIPAQNLVLPLAISFFTFQQIAYLVGCYRQEVEEKNFLNYCLFVTFFPQLIAGPIVHYREVLPQFAKKDSLKLSSNNIAVGITIFALGLFKKVVIADSLAVYASPIFNASENGVILTFFEAWVGTLAYTFQLYFDFSGYSDMAIGLGRLFGITLPQNFNSPYKSKNIVEFWRRWHITLSRFLRDYLYIPLGGNRKGKFRRYLNLMITMFLGGLWHGAGWTFIVWGVLHGVYLIVNHAWRKMKIQVLGERLVNHFIYAKVAQLLTFFVVVLAWVFFRAESFSSANSILCSMLGAYGISLPEGFAQLISLSGGYVEFNGPFNNDLIDWVSAVVWIAISLLICWLAPNTQQITSLHRPCLEEVEVFPSSSWFNYKFRFSHSSALTISAVLLCSILYIARAGEFLYFNF